MARKDREAERNYQRAYYQKRMQDPEKKKQRAQQTAYYAVRRNFKARATEWETLLLSIRGMEANGVADREIAVELAKKYKYTINKSSEALDKLLEELESE